MPVLLPLWPRPGASEILEWLTDVMITENGTEERSEMRVEPRQAFSFSYFVPLDQRANVANIVYGGRTDQWYVPVWPQAQRLGVVAAGTLALACETRYSEFRAAGFAMLWESTGKQQIVVVNAIPSAVSLTLGTATLAFDDAWLMPVRLGRLTSDPSRSFNGRTAELSLSFQIEDLAELVPDAPTQYLGADIYFDAGMLDGGRLTEQIEAQVDLMDEGLGRIGYHYPWIYNRPARQHRMFTEDAEATWGMREFLHRRRGRSVPFWMPSFESDFRIVSTGAITNSISVSLDSFLAYAAERDHIAIETSAGWYARAINAANNLGGGVMQIVFDVAIPSTPASDIIRISHLGLRRFAADRVEINSLGGTVFECGVATVEIEP